MRTSPLLPPDKIQLPPEADVAEAMCGWEDKTAEGVSQCHAN